MVSFPLMMAQKQQQQQQWHAEDDDATPNRVCQLNVTRLGRFFRIPPKNQSNGDVSASTRFKGLLLPPQRSNRRSIDARLAPTICAVRVRDEQRNPPEQRRLLKRYQLSRLTEIHDGDDDDNNNNADDETRVPPSPQEQSHRLADLLSSPNKRPDSFASSPKGAPETNNVLSPAHSNVHSAVSHRSPQSRHSSSTKSTPTKCEPSQSPLTRIPVLLDTSNNARGPDCKESDIFYDFDPYGSSFETEDPDNICHHPITNNEVRLRRKQERMKMIGSQESCFVDNDESHELESTPAEDNTESSRRNYKRFGSGNLPLSLQLKNPLARGPMSDDIPSELSFANEYRVGTYLLTTDPNITRVLTVESDGTMSMVADDESLEYSFVEPMRDDCCVFF